jgi:peptide deformylase
VVIEVEENPRYPHQEHIELLVLINPKIKVVSERTEEDWEGCLSVDGFRGRVPRAYAVEVEAYNREAMRLRFRAEGFFARAVQHECDHLDGILYVDRMRDMKTLTNTEDFMRYWVADDSE